MINRRAGGQLLYVVMSLTCATNAAYAKDCSKDTIHRGFEDIAKTVEWVYEQGVDVAEFEQDFQPFPPYRKKPFIAEHISSLFTDMETFEPYTYQNVKSSTDPDYLRGVEKRHSLLEGYSACFKQSIGACSDMRKEDENRALYFKKIFETRNKVQSLYNQFDGCEKFKYYSLKRDFPLEKQQKYDKKGKFFPQINTAIRQDVGHWPYNLAAQYLLERMMATANHASNQLGIWKNKYYEEYRSIKYVASESLEKLASNQNQVAREKEQKQSQLEYQANVKEVKKRLMAGTMKADSLGLVALKYDALNSPMDTVIGSPKLKANNKYYIGGVKVDQLEGGLVRVINDNQGVLTREMVKHTFGIDMTHNQRYAYLKMKSSDIDNLSVNQVIGVVGQYVDNYEYVLTTGESKVAPVFKVIFVEATEQLDVL